jgi:hypothetical protein
LGRFSFLLPGVLLMFGYCGGVGFTQPDHIAHVFSMLSWVMIPVMLILLYQAQWMRSKG